MTDKDKNPWKSVDASGHDWNSGEDFAPTSAPAKATQAAQQTATGVGAAQVPQTVQRTPQAVPQTPAPQVAPQSVSDLRTLAAQPAAAPLPHADASGIRNYLEQSRDAAVQEASERVDRGVTQGVSELARVREDANETYQTQQNQADLDERRALDNQALYMGANGMAKSGVGLEQYGAIQSAAAQNRVTINNARTKLQTDVARQMAEIRATGEFEKSQAYLQATQQYLSQLAQLEQWIQEFDVSVDQFNAQMEESRRNYLLELQRLEMANDQWEREFAANREDTRWNQNFQQGQADIARSQWEREFAANREDTRWNQNFQQGQADRAQEQWRQEFDASRADASWSQLFQQGQADLQRRQYADALADKAKQEALSLAESMMNVGMTPDEDTLKAAGLSKEYAKLYISAVKAAQDLASEQAAVELENKQADTLKKTADAAKALSGETGGTLSASNAKSLADNNVWNDDVYDALKKAGFSEQTLEQRYGTNHYYKEYMKTRKMDELGVNDNPGPGMRESVYAGYKKYAVSVLENAAAPWEQREKALTTRIDAMWPELSAEQRTDLLELLSQYGFSAKKVS